MALTNNSQEIPSFIEDTFPKAIELQLSDQVAHQVAQRLHVDSAASGRCQEKIMLELLDRSIKSF
jgi:hypothetical protein